MKVFGLISIRYSIQEYSYKYTNKCSHIYQGKQNPLCISLEVGGNVIYSPEIMLVYSILGLTTQALTIKFLNSTISKKKKTDKNAMNWAFYSFN